MTTQAHVYAIKDRLLNYFLKPFIEVGDAQTKASISEAVNGDHGHAIQKTPHHFEVWRLGSINEEGLITPNREFLCDCSALVREPSRPRGRPGEGDSGHGRAGARSLQVRGAADRSEDQAQFPPGPTPVTPQAPGKGQEGQHHQNRTTDQGAPGVPGIPGHSER